MVVPATYHHATDNSRVDSIRNESLLSRLEESRQGALDFLLVGGVKLLQDDGRSKQLFPSGKMIPWRW